MAAGATLRSVAAPLAVLAFWGGMIAAALAYPTGYDWRYQTISVLLYPDQNPHGYRWAWAGLWLCGLAGIAWTAQRARHIEWATNSRSGAGLGLLRVGFLCMCLAVLPGRLLPWPKGHELFAILAFLGLCIGATSQIWVVRDGRGSQIGSNAQEQNPTIVRRVLATLPLVPPLLAGLTQAYLALERPDLPWVTPAWRTLGICPALSFGLWEWVSCVALSLSLCLLWERGR
jgi:hypothetical protein